MKYFVYYDVDREDNGLREFAALPVALTWISEKAKAYNLTSLEDFCLIKGDRQKLKAAEVIVKVMTE